MMRFGLPWKGGKSAIAPIIMSRLPSARHFVDLFFGGGAMTHCAILSRKFKSFIANDIEPGVIELFCDAVNGKVRDTERWVSRDEFFANKDSDAFIRLFWSFGYNCRQYIYSREIEPFKRAAHLAVINGDWSEASVLFPGLAEKAIGLVGKESDTKKRRFAFYKAVRKFRLQSLESLESLERLQRLQSLQSLERLESLHLDYRDVPIPGGATVYADPPYRGTDGYGKDFDSDAFWEWCRTRDFPVYVSEYSAPQDFKCIWETSKRCTLSSTNNSKRTTERLFLHERF